MATAVLKGDHLGFQDRPLLGNNRRAPWLLQTKKSRVQGTPSTTCIMLCCGDIRHVFGDAEEVGDAELPKFFEEVQGEERRRANRAKQLLAARLGK